MSNSGKRDVDEDDQRRIDARLTAIEDDLVECRSIMNQLLGDVEPEAASCPVAASSSQPR